MSKNKGKAFPEKLYVTKDVDGNETYFEAAETILEAASMGSYAEVQVAIYRMVGTGTIRTNVTLENTAGKAKKK